MPRTGSHLKIEKLGDAVLGVVLHGDRNRPEPESFRVHFPGGHVDISRCTDGTYWVHIGTPRADFASPDGEPMGEIFDMRIDRESGVETPVYGGAYHVAARVRIRNGS